MALVLLTTANADYDLSSQQTILTHTPSATLPLLVQAIVYLGDGTKNLCGTGGAYEFTALVGSQVVQPAPQTIVFSTDARAAVTLNAITVPANAALTLKAKSPNAGDSDVDVTVYLYDVPAGDLRQISGVAQSAADLKDLADTGYDPTTHKVAGVVLADLCTANSDMRGTDDAFLAADAPANFSDLAIAATGEITVGAFSTAAKAEVEAEVEDALAAHELDGETMDTHLTVITSALIGVAERVGNQVVFMKRDGETTAATVTLAVDGERTDSAIG